MRVTVPISETLQRVKYINTGKVLKQAGLSQEEAVQMACNMAQDKMDIMDNTDIGTTFNANGKPPPRWARRKLLLAVRKATKSRTDNPTMKMALQSTDWKEWIEAINTEFETLESGHQWDIVLQIPQGQTILPSHIVLVQKRDSLGNKTRKKGRLVAGGNHQDSSLLEAVSSPTCRSASVKMLFSIAAKRGLKVHMADVKAAYTKAVLDEGDEVYLRLPPRPRNINGQCVLDKTPV